jgi:hypothetical protein
MTKKSNTKQQSVDGQMALWIMAPFGLVFPAAVTEKERQKYGLGPDDIQVRGRVESHLNALRQHYLSTLSPVYLTPDQDYDVRAFCTRPAFADALYAMALDIDGRRFKPLVDGKLGLRSKRQADALHDCYVSIWSVVYRLSSRKPFTTRRRAS